jgi:hypothetical protein
MRMIRVKIIKENKGLLRLHMHAKPALPHTRSDFVLRSARPLASILHFLLALTSPPPFALRYSIDRPIEERLLYTRHTYCQHL